MARETVTSAAFQAAQKDAQAAQWRRRSLVRVRRPAWAQPEQRPQGTAASR